MRIALSDDEFNRTAFEYLIGTGVASIDQPRDLPDEDVLEQYFQVKDRNEGIAWPVESMAGFPIGSGNHTGSQLFDPVTFTNACAAAHKVVFSIAVVKLLSESSSTQKGTISYRISGILISRLISAVVEVLLTISAALAETILLHCHKARTELSRNPSSLGRIMEIAQRNPALLEQFSPMDRRNKDSPKKTISKKLFKTQQKGGETYLFCVSEEMDDTSSRQELGIDERSRNTSAGRVQPLILQLKVGSVEIMLGGLPRPSNHFEVLQLLENYIPTIFATFLEAFWVLLNRILFDVEYGTQHQQQRFLNMSRDTVVDRKGQPVFYTDHEQLVLSNLSTHTALPSWTTPEAYFLPFAHSPGSSLPADVLKANATGVSLEPRCSVVTTDDASETYVHVVVNTTHQQLSLNSVADDGSRIQCGMTTAWLYNTTVSGPFEDTVMYVTQSMGQSSLELVTGLSSIGSSQAKTAEAAIFCSKRILSGWLHGGIRTPPTVKFIQCEPLLHVASYEVKADSQDSILGQERVSDPRDAGSVFGANRTQKLPANMFILATTDSENEWHNATVTRDWANIFLKLHLNTTSHINPELPVPDPKVMLPALRL
ncbi:hypothetical protein SCARD494_02389 [Seiridium cardinale]